MKRFRLSPALVIAVMALVAALAGSAVAQQATTSAKPVTKKKVKKISKKQANKAVDAALPIGASELGSITETSETSTATVAPPISATATCPDGTKVLSGGYSASPLTLAGSGTIVHKSKKSDNGWTAEGMAIAPGDSITAHAYCLSAEDG